MTLPVELVRTCAREALAEDLGDGVDLTSRVSVPEGLPATGVILAREDGVLAGLELAKQCFAILDSSGTFTAECEDGAVLRAGDVIARVSGDARAILAAERTALNFLQHLSGVATLTRRFVAAVDGLAVSILDTRKTTPLLRVFEKRAVRVGGGDNHRAGLFDQILLKENHFSLAGRPYQQVVEAAVATAKATVVAEAQTLEEGLAAVVGGAGVVLLDNFAPGDDLSRVVASIRERADQLGRVVQIEVSGRVTLSTVRSFAECGVDRISVGALTHSAGALDISMTTELPRD